MNYVRRRLGTRPRASFGDIFQQYIAPTVSTAGNILDKELKVKGFAGKPDNGTIALGGVGGGGNSDDTDTQSTDTQSTDTDTKAAYGKVIRPHGQRNKAWIGMAVGAAMNIVGGIFGNAAKKRAEARKREQEFRQAQLKTMQNNANSFNKQMDYLRQNENTGPDLEYRLGGTPNRLRLGANNFVITDGGDARKIGHNTFLLRGGSHDDVNETGQTGIGINVGGNEIEAEGGEVAQKKGDTLRIFSAQPILKNGVSPAEAVEAGANKDKVFNAQQAFKRRNHLKDDGSKAKFGDSLTSYFSGDNDNSYEYPKKKTSWDGSTSYFQYQLDKMENGRRVNFAKFDNDKAGQNRRLMVGNMERIQDRLIAANVPVNQRIAMLSAIASESGGDPKAKDASGNFQGIIQWSKDRRPKNMSLDSQVNSLISTSKNYDGNNWNHGGKRSGHKTGKEAHDAFWSAKSTDDASLAYGRGYVRPKHDAANRNRLAQARTMKAKYSSTSDGRNNPDERFRQDYSYIARPVSKIPVMPWQRKRCGGRIKAGGGTWVKPRYNTSTYNGSRSIRRAIASYEGTDFAKQNAQFHGDAVGAKEKELRRFMGDAYNNLNDKQRDALLSYYYNVKPSTFTSRYGALRDRLIRASNEVEFNDTLNLMKTSINTGMNNSKLKGLRKRRLYEQGLFGGNGSTTTAAPVRSTSTKATSPTVTKATTTQSQQVEAPAAPVAQAPAAQSYQGYGGFVSNEDKLFTFPTGRLYDYILAQGNKRQPQRLGGSKRRRCSGGTAVSRPIEKKYDSTVVTPAWRGVPTALPDTWDTKGMFKTDNNIQPSNTADKYPYDRTATPKVDDDFNAWTYQRTNVPNDSSYWQTMADKTGHTPDEMKSNNVTLRSDGKVGYNYLTPLRLPAEEKNIWQEANDDIQKGADKWQKQTRVSGPVTTSPIQSNNGNNNGGGFGNDNWEMRPTNGDWIGLGIDTLSALGTGFINNLYLNKANYDYVTPEWVAAPDAILDTKYRNAAQRAAVERNRLNNVKTIMRNTGSSAVAQQRAQKANTNATYENNRLWDDKMNKELELRNRQAELNANIHAHNAESKNNWFSTVAAIKNKAIEDRNANDLAKAQSFNATLSGLSQAYNNFYTSARQRYEDDVAMKMYMAGSQYATPSRMLAFGVPMSDGQLVGIMNDIRGMKNPGPKPDKKDYQNATEYSKALSRWEEDSRAYKHKQEYYNLAQSRLSKKGRRRLGIR